MTENKNLKISETKKNILEITGAKLLNFLNLDKNLIFKTEKNTELGYTVFDFSQDKIENTTVYINNNYLFSSLNKADYDYKYQEIFDILDYAIKDPYGVLNIDHRSTELQKEKEIAVVKIKDTGLVAKIRFGENQPNFFNKLTAPIGRNINDFRAIAKAVKQIKGSSLSEMIEFCPTFAYIDFIKKYDQRIDVIIMQDLTKYPRLATIDGAYLVNFLPPNLIESIGLSTENLSKNIIIRRLQKTLEPNKGSPPQAAGYSLLKQNCLF